LRCVTPQIILKPGRDRSVLRGHPWVFSGAIDRVTGAIDSGDTVEVLAADGTRLGLAAYSPSSQIRARMWGHVDAVGAELIAARITAAAQRRVHLAPITNAVRIVSSEADGIPGLTADRYGDVIVCQFTSAGAERWRPEITDSLAAVPGVTHVFERSDVDVRAREGLEPRVGPLVGGPPPPAVVVEESGLRFHVDVAAGHKTGFYLDQRDARALLPLFCDDGNVLNVCAYTGAFSVIAARAGAASITSIDSSAAALAGARRNAELNGVDIGELVEADAFTELRRLRDRAKSYDVIILDPPKLALNEKQLDKASRAYKDLNLLALKLLAPGGTLLTFSCSGAMGMDLFQKVVAGAALDARREARIIGRLHQPSDHPVPLNFPEAEYLKGLVVTVG
jgi:23S rRNA (cytosine1962-C5)-methyltransferase